MIIKDFLHQLKKDYGLFKCYPNVSLDKDFDINYERYWKIRRGEKYTSVLSSWQKQRVDIVSRIFKKGDVVLDLGGGDGEILKEINNRVGGIKMICVDFNETVLKAAKENGCDVLQMDLSKMDDVARLPDCDYIIGFEILEHMVNPEELISIIKNKARKGMMFSFPNTGYYVYRLRLLFGRFPVQWISHPAEHVRFWTIKDVKWWVGCLELKMHMCRTYEGLPILKNIAPTIFGKGTIIHISK